MSACFESFFGSTVCGAGISARIGTQREIKRRPGRRRLRTKGSRKQKTGTTKPFILETSFCIYRSLLFQDLAGSYRPEHKVDLVEIDSDVGRKALKPFFHSKISASRRGRLGIRDHAELGQAAQNVFIKDRVTPETDISEEMACFLITEALYALVICKPIAALKWAAKALKPCPNPWGACRTQMIAAGDNVSRPGIRISVNSSERPSQFGLGPGGKKGTNGLDGPKPHFC